MKGENKMTTIQEHYLALQEAQGLKEGDKVKILRTAKDYEMGWGVIWIPLMSEFVGKMQKGTVGSN